MEYIRWFQRTQCTGWVWGFRGLKPTMGALSSLGNFTFTYGKIRRNYSSSKYKKLFRSVSKWFPYIQWFPGLRVGYGGEGIFIVAHFSRNEAVNSSIFMKHIFSCELGLFPGHDIAHFCRKGCPVGTVRQCFFILMKHIFLSWDYFLGRTSLISSEKAALSGT